MAIQFDDAVIRITGVGSAEDAMPLADWLAGRDEGALAPSADLAGCSGLHTAVVQLLMARGVMVTNPPADPFLVEFIVPLLRSPDQRLGAVQIRA